jgi:hypothetical protein
MGTTYQIQPIDDGGPSIHVFGTDDERERWFAQ